MKEIKIWINRLFFHRISSSSIVNLSRANVNLFLSCISSLFLTTKLIVNTPNTHILAIRSILGSNLRNCIIFTFDLFLSQPLLKRVSLRFTEVWPDVPTHQFGDSSVIKFLTLLILIMPFFLYFFRPFVSYISQSLP